MARTVRDDRLDSRSARLKLSTRAKPYTRSIEQGRHLLYYRGKRGGSWSARMFCEGRYKEARLGTADDTIDANGVDILNFSEAQAAARDWFAEQAKAARGISSAGPYTVADALDDYLKDYTRRGGKDITNTTARVVRIKNDLGAVVLQDLTRDRLRKWLGEIADAPARLRTRKGAQTRNVRSHDSTDKAAVRKRRASANRILTVFKAAANHAFADGKVLTDAAWRAVRPFRDVDHPKIAYLQEDEAVRLINACDPEFRQLVRAALLTGARYGELCRMDVGDLDKVAGVVHVRESKSGRPRTIALTPEGVKHFEALAVGRPKHAPLVARKGGRRWSPSEQARPMAAACKAASILPAISFHILRHSYGSRLTMRGVPLAVVAEQLGHADTRVTTRHYAHLAPGHVADTIRAAMGEIGGADEASNVRSIK